MINNSVIGVYNTLVNIALYIVFQSVIYLKIAPFYMISAAKFRKIFPQKYNLHSLHIAIRFRSVIGIQCIKRGSDLH